jgi:hypothetical protein
MAEVSNVALDAPCARSLLSTASVRIKIGRKAPLPQRLQPRVLVRVTYEIASHMLPGGKWNDMVSYTVDKRQRARVFKSLNPALETSHVLRQAVRRFSDLEYVHCRVHLQIFDNTRKLYAHSVSHRLRVQESQVRVSEHERAWARDTISGKRTSKLRARLGNDETDGRVEQHEPETYRGSPCAASWAPWAAYHLWRRARARCPWQSRPT